MVSTKPYLIRAIYEWCVDQGFTPYIAVQVGPRTRVPSGYAKDGRIVLNIGPEATDKIKIDNEQITFQARFSGVPHQILVPVDNVAAIYARENGQGMPFDVSGIPEGTPATTGADTPPDGLPPPTTPPPRGSHLKVIK